METQSARERMVILPLALVRELCNECDQALRAFGDGLHGTAISTLEAVWRELDAAIATAEASHEQ